MTQEERHDQEKQLVFDILKGKENLLILKQSVADAFEHAYNAEDIDLLLLVSVALKNYGMDQRIPTEFERARAIILNNLRQRQADIIPFSTIQRGGGQHDKQRQDLSH